MDKNPLFHRRLAAAIAAAGKSKQAVAAAIGATPNTISRYLSGRVTPKESIVLSLAVVLDVHPDWLAGRARAHTPAPAFHTHVAETRPDYRAMLFHRVELLGEVERVALEQFLRGLTGPDPAIRQHLIGQMRIIDRALGPSTDEEAAAEGG